MTRETKLGLLIGLAVILLVGLILTDHLSVAQHRKPPRLTDFAGATQQSLRPPSVIDTDEVMNRRLRRPHPSSDRPAKLRLPQASAADGPTAGHGPQMAGRVEPIKPIEIQPGVPRESRDDSIADPQNRPTPAPEASNGRPSHIYHLVQGGEGLGSIADHYYGDGRMWRVLKTANPDVIGPENSVRDGDLLKIPDANSLVQFNQDDFAATAAESDGDRQAPPGTTDRGMVRATAGDTFSSLAEAHLGSAKQWRILFLANAAVLKLDDPRDLRPDMVLKLPSTTRVENLEPARRPAARARRHKVERGDTLTSISELLLGDGRHWRLIHKANRSKIPEPNNLRVGIQLDIPSADLSR